MSQPKAPDQNLVSPFKTPDGLLLTQDFLAFCHAQLAVSPERVRRDLQSWLEEDHGGGCVTLMALGPAASTRTAEMAIVAKESFVLAGLQLMAEVFRLAGGSAIELRSDKADGQLVKPGDVILWGRAPGAALLLGERVALNLGSRLSGIASKTREVIEALAAAAVVAHCEPPTLLETRKTTPGLRIYEKYATRAGGARNHRHGLDGGAMLKENHLRLTDGIGPALASLQTRTPILTRVEIEVTNLAEFHEALAGGADVIMLDNFSPADVRQAVARRAQRSAFVKLEISGNLDRRDLAELAALGVDFASMGALTHQARWVDMSQQLYPTAAGA